MNKDKFCDELMKRIRSSYSLSYLRGMVEAYDSLNNSHAMYRVENRTDLARERRIDFINAILLASGEAKFMALGTVCSLKEARDVVDSGTAFPSNLSLEDAAEILKPYGEVVHDTSRT